MIQSSSTVKREVSDDLTRLSGPRIPAAGGQLLGEEEEDYALPSLPFHLPHTTPKLGKYFKDKYVCYPALVSCCCALQGLEPLALVPLGPGPCAQLLP